MATWRQPVLALAIFAAAAAAQVPGGGPPGPGAIDALIADGRHDDALAACVEVAADPGGRDLARFLHQYGIAQHAAGHPRDASVSFARCAIHHADTVHAVASLIELAVIYRTTYDRPETARRLLERAAATARAIGRDDLARRAEERMRGMTGRSGATGEGDRR